MEAVMDYFLSNGEVLRTTEYAEEEVSKTPSIYEVVRVIDGVPLFLEEHLQRLRQSARLIGHEVETADEEISRQIKLLVDKNLCKHHNLKIVVNGFKEGKQNLFLYFIETQYPDAKLYRKGIHTILYREERENPNAKVVNPEFKGKINNLLKEAGAYEAILVNRKGEITEGSRSNIFFVKDEAVFTSPKQAVLLGITREHIIRLCGEMGIKVVEEPILEADLWKFDSAFMTGTSPKVLPISSIEGLVFPSPQNQVILKIKKAFDDEIERYILSRK